VGTDPASARLEEAAQHAMSCRACHLWEKATQTVFGEGPSRARMMLVGEQPGDKEDIQGHPFVGPAGRILDDALADAGVERRDVYVTNAVKHFKWRAGGKRRIHDKPNRQEVLACRPWLERELELVEPAVLVALGATAAQALLGPSFRLTAHLGEVMTTTGLAPHVMATVHPSLVLRTRDPAEREAVRSRLSEDLATAMSFV
jgi:uracil-DNA glycosylase family protein